MCILISGSTGEFYHLCRLALVCWVTIIAGPVQDSFLTSRELAFPTTGQESTKLSPALHLEDCIVVLVQQKKGSDAKEESYCCTEPLKDWTKFTTHNNEKQKRNSVFSSRQFCFPETGAS
jgi:hypothetical protein